MHDNDPVIRAMLITGAMALAVLISCALYDTWRNRKRYAARKLKRKAKGGLN